MVVLAWSMWWYRFFDREWKSPLVIDDKHDHGQWAGGIDPCMGIPLSITLMRDHRQWVHGIDPCMGIPVGVARSSFRMYSCCDKTAFLI